MSYWLPIGHYDIKKVEYTRLVNRTSVCKELWQDYRNTKNSKRAQVENFYFAAESSEISTERTLTASRIAGRSNTIAESTSMLIRNQIIACDMSKSDNIIRRAYRICIVT